MNGNHRVLLVPTLIAGLLLALTGCGGGGGGSSTPAYTHQQAYTSQTTSLQALLYLPDGYDTDQSKRWPLIVYLHGSNQRGNDLSLLVPGTGPPSRIEQGFQPPFIVLSPQCPSSDMWASSNMVNRLYALINEVLPVYRIDPKKICLTGFSMGGDGTWAEATAHPELFAAVAPIGANAYYPNATVLKATPLWVFHGNNDTVCPIANDSRMVQDLQNAGSTKVKFTVWPGADHTQSCTLSYLDDPDGDLYQWFAAQTLP